MNQKGLTNTALIVGVLVVLVGIGGYLMFVQKTSPESVPSNQQTTENTNDSANTPSVNAAANVTIDLTKSPTCKVTTNLTRITSPDQKIAFSWTSTNTEVVNSDYPVQPQGAYKLASNGNGTLTAREGLSVTKPGGTEPDTVNFRFTVSNKAGSDACWLTLPYQL